MTTAQPFPSNWGYDQLVNNTDVINTSLSVWANAGETGASVPIVATIAIGAIPILLGAMVYIRYQKLGPSLVVMLLSLLGVTGIERFYGLILIAPIVMTIMYSITGFILTFNLFYTFWNKS